MHWSNGIGLAKNGNIDQDGDGLVGCEKDVHHKSPICIIAQTTCGFVDLMTAAWGRKWTEKHLIVGLLG